MDLRDAGLALLTSTIWGFGFVAINLQSNFGESGLQIVRVHYGGRFDFGIQMVE